MCGGFARTTLLAALWLAASTLARGAPTLLQHVDGYTLSGGALIRFDALAFDQGRVLAAGNGAALARRYPQATRLDGRGRTLLPGLIDAHGHVLDLGMESTQIRLVGSASLAEAQQRIRAYAGAHRQMPWLLGDGWNQVLWKLGRFPLAAELDQAAGDRPAALWRVDGHAVWLNTRALRLAGITRATPDPVGGRIERNADGEPAGVLVDKAMALVERVVPPPTAAGSRAALRAAFAHMNSVGL
ncbi:MAG: amidohydrolase family protein, partial [Gammaproteobacteria bacterium]|nr:amidohydrolase family protein [Gammaproteobacteria bacterium]